MSRRLSILNVARFCSSADDLAKQHGGASRAAMLGRVFHAICEDRKDQFELLALLTEEEQEIVGNWHKPKDMELSDGVVLAYDRAHKEEKIALGPNGSAVPYDSEQAITRGIVDLYWLVDRDGTRTLYLGDLKRSRFTEFWFLDSLQLHAAALALADDMDADEYVVGLWFCEEGEWHWGEPIDLFSKDADRWSKLVRHAATHRSGFVTGPHCRRCYQRKHCPEYMAPAATGMEALNDIDSMTPELALKALVLRDRLRETADVIDGRLKIYADEKGGIANEAAGKVWKAIPTQGKETLDKKALGSQVDLAQYTKVGKPSVRYDWVNQK